MKKVRLILIPILLAGLLCSCSTLNIGTPSDPSKLTPKQFATFAMGLYNRQYADYKAQVASPGLTDAQKQILVKKKAILAQAYPLISTFDLSVAAGQATTKDQETAIMGLLNQIQTLVITK